MTTVGGTRYFTALLQEVSHQMRIHQARLRAQKTQALETLASGVAHDFNNILTAVLAQMEGKAGQKLNWQTSIVDLMKLLGLDSSLENRKELAKELAFAGDMNDSASMNTWLHKAVMQKLAANGGKVPDELKG